MKNWKLFTLASTLIFLSCLLSLSISCGDDDDDDDNDDEGPEGGDSNTAFDPMGHLEEAFNLAHDALPVESPELFGIAAINTWATPADVSLTEKEFAWVYDFTVAEDSGNPDTGYYRINVTVKPEKSAEIVCEGSFMECTHTTVELDQADFDAVTLNLKDMVEMATDMVTFDVHEIDILKPMDPSYQYIQYVLINEDKTEGIAINAESGEQTELPPDDVLDDLK